MLRVERVRAQRSFAPPATLDFGPRTLDSPLAAAVVPGVAGLAVGEGFAAAEDGAGEEGEMFARGVEFEFPGGGEDGVAMQYGDAFVFLARKFFEALAEFDFFAGVEVGVEAAEFAEGGGLAKDEGAGAPAEGAADAVPEVGDGVAGGVAGREADGAAAGEAAAGLDLGGDVVEEGGAGVGVGIDEDEPIAGGGLGAAVAGAADLVLGFEGDGGTGIAGDLGGAVGGVVIANDEFGLPVAAGEGGHGGLDVAKGFAEQAFFVVGGHYDGDEHA